MVKRLTEINKTAVFAWSPGQQAPYIASGTAAGALDDSFSNASELELFKLDLSSSTGLHSAGKISSTARFNKLVWGNATSTNPYGVIAGGLENNHLVLWDPSKIIDGKSDEETVIMDNETHTGQVRGLDFNKFQTNLLASAGSNNEVYIWDLTNPSTPYTPGPKSQKLDDITSVGWNGQVQHILATTSSTGHTVVWDLRNRKEVMTLSAPNTGGLNAGRRSISSVVWHPDVATQLVTASEDDSNPVVTLWDLRHAHSPEKILAGHSKGVLSLSWCRQDSDLLMSCGKDCKTLIWNPNSGELLGELAQDNNWTFQTEWCPRNPDLLASASFDGKIGVYSLQNSESDDTKTSVVDAANDDPFSAAMNAAAANNASTFALRHPPKWLRCPVGATFGFGGKLVTFNNKAGQAAAQAAASLPPGQAPTNQKVPRSVAINTIVTDKDVVKRSEELQTALEHQSVEQLVEERVQQVKEEDEKESWEVIKTLLAEDAREQLMNYLGFQKSEVIAAVAKATAGKKGLDADEAKEEQQEIPVKEEPAGEAAALKVEEATEEEKKPETEEVAAEKPNEPAGENTTSGLFANTEGDDFFAQSGINGNNEEQVVEEDDGGISAAVAANALASAVKVEPLQLYTEGSSETDRLITRAVVLGDFESAVKLCLAADRFSDALLFAICGGGDLLARTQQAYFRHQSKSTSYLRLLESVIDEDLSSVVASVSLEEWTSVIVVLCTFAKAEDFRPLCEALGARLEEGWSSAETEKAKEFRRHATLCYLAAGNLEKVSRIWIAEQEEEAEAADSESAKFATLQNLIEKVTIFRKVIAYEDSALFETNENKLSYEYPLSPLYDKYCEYAELLAAQGKLTTALTYLSLTPVVYRKSTFDKLSIIRDRVFQACPVNVASQFAQPAAPFEAKAIAAKVEEPQTQPAAQQAYAQPQQYQTSYPSYQNTTQQTSFAPVRSPVASNKYATLTNAYTPAASAYSPTVSNTYAPTAATNSYAPTASTTYAPTAVNNTYAPVPATNNSYAPTQASATSSYAPTTASGPPTNLYQPQGATSSPSTASYGYNQPSAGANTYNYGATNTYGNNQYNNTAYSSPRPTIPAPPPIGGVAPTPLSQTSTPPPPPKKAEGAWNDPPMSIAAAKKLKSPKVSQSSVKRVTSPFPNQPSASSFVNSPQQHQMHQQQSNLPPPPPQGAFPPPPMNRGPPPPRAGPPPMAGPPRGPPQQRPLAPPPQGGYYQQQR